MADPPPYSDTGEAPGTPRWVKVFGIIALVLVLAFGVVKVTGGGLGEHGPGRHTPGGDASERHKPPPGVDTSGRHKPPPGVPEH